MKLQIKNLSKKFTDNIVLDDINFTFEKGKIYALLGKNGSGKTTLFNIINEDLKACRGTIILDDEKINTSEIGYVVSTPVVPDFLTAREFIRFFIDIHDLDIDIDESLKMVGIEEKDRDKLLKTFSHGMKNKVQMLINFLGNPKVLLLDEPLTSFDILAAEEMKNVLRKQKKNSIIIFSTHILELAIDLCDEIVLLHNGKLEIISKDVKSNKNFKDKIISALKGDNDDE